MISFSHLHQSQRLPGHHYLHLISPVVSRWSRCCFFVLYSPFSPLLLPPGTWRSLNKHTRCVLYGVSWAAHKVPQPGGLKQHDTFISALETGTLKAGRRQGRATLKYLEDGPSLSPPAFGGGRQPLASIPCLVDTSLQSVPPTSSLLKTLFPPPLGIQCDVCTSTAGHPTVTSYCFIFLRCPNTSALTATLGPSHGRFPLLERSSPDLCKDLIHPSHSVRSPRSTKPQILIPSQHRDS